MTKRIFPSDKIYLGQSKIARAGKGVFAKTKIKDGEVVEVCPTIEISFKELERSEKPINYVFFSKNKAYLALGFGSFYNHSARPNLFYKISAKEKTIRLTALRAIKKDEELVFDYRGKAKGKKPLWFES